MIKHTTIGVVTPGIKLEAVLYDEGNLQRYPVVVLDILRESKEGDISTIIQPLCWSEEAGNVIHAAEIGYYLGLEAESKHRDWSKEKKKLEEQLEEQKKHTQEVERLSKLPPEDKVKELEKLFKKIDQEKLDKKNN